MLNSSLYNIICRYVRFTLTVNKDKLTASQHCRRPPPCLLIAVVQSATAHAHVFNTASTGQQREVHFTNSLGSLRPVIYLWQYLLVERNSSETKFPCFPLYNTIIVRSGQPRPATLHTDDTLHTLIWQEHRNEVGNIWPWHFFSVLKIILKIIKWPQPLR